MLRDDPLEYVDPPMRFEIGPRSWACGANINIPDATMRNLGHVRIYIYGEASYSDVFESESHLTTFCYEIVPVVRWDHHLAGDNNRENSPNSYVYFRLCPHHNNAT